jgi:hypothetical protein
MHSKQELSLVARQLYERLRKTLDYDELHSDLTNVLH